jgi:uncharacterized protein (DUF736 family)
VSYEKDENELGALWEKQGAKGTYFTGKIGDQPVVIFKNGNKKEGSNAPDWRVMKPVKRDRDQDQRVPVSHPSEPVNDSDIPF